MKNTITILLATSLLALTFFVIFQHYHTPKIAYVNTGKLLEEYQAMQDARAEYDAQTDEWKKNMETLQLEIRQEISNYQKQSSKLTPQAKLEAEKKIRAKQEQYFSYKKAVEEKSAIEEERLGRKVLKKVDAFIKQYSKDENFDIVLGTTESGTILFGTDKYDITPAILKALNEQYIPRKKD